MKKTRGTKADHYIERMNRDFLGLLRQAAFMTFGNPRLAFFLIRQFFCQKRAARLRARYAKEGLHVPPFMITSITRICNLRCKGCYAMVHHNASASMSKEKIGSILQEASGLGISICLLAGGEPLTRPEIFELTARHPEIIFPLFTNGLLIDENMAVIFRNQRHLVPILSLEGHEKATDERRGAGVYSRLREKMALLNRHRVFWGLSLTITSENYSEITDDGFVRELEKSGSRIFFYVEYVPVDGKTENLCLTDTQRSGFLKRLETLRATHRTLFIAFPGDEEAFGGCLAAGRGFIHISPDGGVEPCPFAPYSDVNLTSMSLREAINSDFLRRIRDNHSLLTDTKGGCALWEKRDWVESLLPPPGKG